MACLELCPPDETLVKAHCFAGLGRIELSLRSHFAVVYLEKAHALYRRLAAEEALLDAVGVALLHARALERKFASHAVREEEPREGEGEGELHIIEYVVRLAQEELRLKHYRHCALALDCIDALCEDDDIVLEICDRMRRKLARKSRQAVRETGLSVEQAMDVLETIQREDTPGRWARSWTPWVISFAVLSTLAGAAVVLYNLPKRDGGAGE